MQFKANFKDIIVLNVLGIVETRMKSCLKHGEHFAAKEPTDFSYA